MVFEKLVVEEAQNILSIFYRMNEDGNLYLYIDDEKLDQLFFEVIAAINDTVFLKTELPYIEFALPSMKVMEGDMSWIGHFRDRDNKRFFLSDLYDYLTLMYADK